VLQVLKKLFITETITPDINVIIAAFNKVVFPLNNPTAKYKGNAENKNIITEIRNAINTAVVNISIILLKFIL
jgi:hypothetical protein